MSTEPNLHLHRGVTCTAQRDGVESTSARSRRNDNLGKVVGVTAKTDDRFIPIAAWYTGGRTRAIRSAHRGRAIERVGVDSLSTIARSGIGEVEVHQVCQFG